MASPVGHTLLATACCGWSRPEGRRDTLVWFTLLIVAANAPDLDFLPGLLVGDPNRYHHGASHSMAVGAACAAGAGWAASLAGGRGGRVAAIVLFAWLSHLLGDWLAADPKEPRGVPLLWPWIDRPFIAPVTVFLPVDHGSPGDPLGTFAGAVLSTANLAAILVELAVTGPLALAGLAIRRRRRGQSQRSSRT